MPATRTRKIVVHIATSADGYIARTDGGIDWLSDRPAPKGFYGMPQFMRSVDATILGRKTFEVSLQMGAKFDGHGRSYVFSRRPPPARVPAGVEFVTGSIRDFAARLRGAGGKTVWMMGGGELIASFLDEGAIDDFVVTVVPVFIGEGIPLIARRRRHARLRLHASRSFPDGVVQNHYEVLS
jgi:dihydrofolate reductase